jgi:hypothetical protein
MKLRHTTIPRDEQEEALSREIRRLTLEEGAPAAPPPAYWAHLLVRTNQGIDRATSPRALTISWAARVAVPGVLAILSFLVALRYFVPVNPESAAPLKALVLSMPERSVDTLLANPRWIGASLTAEDLEVEPPDPPKEELAEYLIASGRISSVTEALSSDQVTDVLTILGSRSSDLTPGAH